MPKPHGSKMYSQLLIDCARYQLIEQEAERRGIAATKFMRDIIYEKLDQYILPAAVRHAERIDEAAWQQSVKNRVAGRKKKKEERSAA